MPRCHEGTAPARGRHGSWGSPKPRLDARRLVAGHWVNAEVSSTPDVVLEPRIRGSIAAASATFQDFCSQPAGDRSGSDGHVARTATERKSGPSAGEFRFNVIAKRDLCKHACRRALPSARSASLGDPRWSCVATRMQASVRVQADRVCAASRLRQNCPARSVRPLKVPLVREGGLSTIRVGPMFRLQASSAACRCCCRSTILGSASAACVEWLVNPVQFCTSASRSGMLIRGVSRSSSAGSSIGRGGSRRARPDVRGQDDRLPGARRRRQHLHQLAGVRSSARWAWAQSVKLRAGRLVTAVMSPVGSELNGSRVERNCSMTACASSSGMP